MAAAIALVRAAPVEVANQVSWVGFLTRQAGGAAPAAGASPATIATASATAPSTTTALLLRATGRAMPSSSSSALRRCRAGPPRMLPGGSLPCPPADAVPGYAIARTPALPWTPNGLPAPFRCFLRLERNTRIP